MRKQSGFTLIELLLVLAIIGIISAIAIPAMLSQRARARDKVSLENMVGRIGDLAGQWDKGKEKGLASSVIVTSMQAYLAANTAKDKNPWDGINNAFNTADPISGGTAQTASGFANVVAALATVKGESRFGVQTPGGNGFGFIGGAVMLNASSLSDTTPKVRTKVTSLE